ncbi:DnaJ-domain-containing protein [Tilletiaria anomala UBC 951]|uniref:DnaJ-domain-containing protein n=1 Tax=Tilletiaria anomala (strain ATCC 24038 / CBS 436.72 / UBC 951) TaxID=1037660 RepID=A0A066WQH0_TILAU|nr:DnaJ-domain-containing protein [Tilletiaria anomala UBC 951]KDN52845.1 DnaJ-domain-containing protein [Tilletiaria anomala UBC 951]
MGAEQHDANTIGVEDAYAQLNLEVGASETDVKSAYRKLSLKLHPDKRRDVDSVQASAEFHRLQLAYELLCDPSKRQAAEKQAAQDAAARARRGTYDGKRKAAADDLDRREDEDRRRRKAQAQAEVDLARKLQQIQEENKRLKEEAQRKRDEALRDPPAQLAAVPPPTTQVQEKSGDEVTTDYGNSAFSQPPIGPLDTTVVVKFPTDQSFNLTGLSDPMQLVSADSLGKSDFKNMTPLGQALSASFGPLEALAIHPPKLRKKTGKLASEMSAAAMFTTIDAAYAAVSAGQQLNARGLLADCWIGWASATSKGNRSSNSGGADENGDRFPNAANEPARIRWMREKGILPNLAGVPLSSPLTNGGSGQAPASEVSAAATKASRPTASFSFSPFSISDASNTAGATASKLGDGYESITLMRLREAERRRLETEILAREQAE